MNKKCEDCEYSGNHGWWCYKTDSDTEPGMQCDDFATKLEGNGDE